MVVSGTSNVEWVGNDVSAEVSDVFCVYALEGFDCSGICIDANDLGFCALEEILVCTNADATNFDVEANVDDGGCLVEGHLPNGFELSA